MKLNQAARRVYTAGRNGMTMALKDSEKFEVIASNKLDERFEGSPVLVGTELFLRERENLYCIAEK